MKKPRILFIGHGKIGSAIHHVIEQGKKKTVDIDCWDVDSARAPGMCELSVSVPRADIIFLCVPSWNLVEAAKNIQPYLSKKTILVGVSKGLDRDTFETLDVTIASRFPRQPFVLLFGPMLADELLAGRVGAASVASKNVEARNKVTQLFASTLLRVVPTGDVRGVALCGVLKNVYAIGLGIAKELQLGDNFNGWYVEQAFSEMQVILKALGGKTDTLLAPAGIGDFLATGFSLLSKNVTHGRELVQKGTADTPSEGAVSIKPLAKRLGAVKKNLVLFNQLERIVLKGANPRSIIGV